jgi:hypothetical protein
VRGAVALAVEFPEADAVVFAEAVALEAAPDSAVALEAAAVSVAAGAVASATGSSETLNI